ncbi:AraC family transcriptional regulator [uncultured Psychroserpens sp.]|uniref:helix-turn-helix transcriptional regulator n=1 Tax=uncultured Psychroserpens sp. TaxID=255436 RepID=UPI00262465DD|nr:AraC family transcriptional regulator [uncultured Psychroserpens sp.]
MIVKELNSSYKKSDFPEIFSDEIYFSDLPSGTRIGGYKYKAPYCIKYAVTGFEKYILNDKEYTIKNGEHFLVNNENEVTTHEEGFGKCISIFIDGNTVKEVYNTLCGKLSYKLNNAGFSKLSAPLFYEKSYKNENNKLNLILKKLSTIFVDQKFYDLDEIYPNLNYDLSEALINDQNIHSHYLNNIKVAKHSTLQELYYRLSLGKEYIIDNYNKPFSLKETSSVSMLSPYHFHREFKKVFGMTPMGLHNKIRTQKSLKLVKNSNFSIQEISFLLGFSNCSSFIKSFKSSFGITPLMFRKQN